MNTSKTKVAAISIVDFYGEYQESYISWLSTFLKRTFYQDTFDVFVATRNETTFLESKLYAFLKDLIDLGLVRNILPIQFNVFKHGVEGYTQLLGFCENFREVNEGSSQVDYSWYYCISADFIFDQSDIEKFDSFNSSFIDPNRVYFFSFNELRTVANPLSFFMTGNRVKLSMIQNLYTYRKSEHHSSEGLCPIFFIDKMLFKMCDSPKYLEP